MRQTVNCDCKESGIAENDLILAGCGGVTVEGSLYVGLDHGTNLGNLAEESKAQLLRFFLRVFRG